MKKANLFLAFLILFSISSIANEREIVLGQGHYGHGNDQIYVEPPVVTYDDDLNELHVYFGSTSSINIEYVDPSGTPYYYVYGENHAGYTSTTYYSLPAGYYTITIHSVYGYTYTGNFSVS